MGRSVCSTQPLCRGIQSAFRRVTHQRPRRRRRRRVYFVPFRNNPDNNGMDQIVTRPVNPLPFVPQTTPPSNVRIPLGGHVSFTRMRDCPRVFRTLPRCSHISAKCACISHIFPHKLAFSTAILIILIFFVCLLKSVFNLRGLCISLIDVNIGSNKKISAQLPPTACLPAN